MDWAAALRTMDERVADVFDRDQCTYHPRSRSDVNAQATPDATRQAFAFNGTIEYDPTRTDIRSSRSAGGEVRLRHVTAEIVLTADVGDWPHEPRVADAVEHPAGRFFAISEIHRDGTDRVALYLNKAS